MQTIHFRNPRRQRFQMHAFDGEQFARDGADMFLVSRVDAVAPLACLLIQIVPAGERASGQKVSLYKAERPLHARRAVGVAALMCHEAEPEAFPERLHFGDRNHLTPGATQHHHMRVIDHHAFDSASHVSQRIGEKHLAIEPLKRGTDLEKQQARITQHRRGGLRLMFPAADLDFVR